MKRAGFAATVHTSFVAISHAARVMETTSRIGWSARYPVADPDDAHVVTRCLFCDESLASTLGTGREWFADHRLERHPELGAPPARSRRTIWRR